MIQTSNVAAKTQTLNPRYIVDGSNIDESFKQYALPIVGELW